MNYEKAKKYLNQVIKTKKYSGPKFLYKYRPFDDYTLDMLENNYVFLCPAEKLDDPTECMTTVDIDAYYDYESNNLKKVCVEHIIEMLRSYTSKENYENIKQLLNSLTNSNGTLSPRILLEYVPEVQSYMPDAYDIAPFVNLILDIPEKLNNHEIKRQLKELLIAALNAKKYMGICSLSENNNDSFMWENYADNNSGYCIEYDLSYYKYVSQVFPVLYVSENERKTEILSQLIDDFIGQMFSSFSNGEIDTDRSKTLSLFLTKYDKWKYQNEWRIIGDANEKIEAPKIRTIYIGSEALIKNVEKLYEFANNHNINIVTLS